MKKLHRILIAFLLSLAVTSAVQAQQTGISGRVTDTQGAVIEGAAIEIRQIGGAAFTTKTTAAGTYLIPSLSAGDYIVTVSASGFSTVRTKVSMPRRSDSGDRYDAASCQHQRGRRCSCG